MDIKNWKMCIVESVFLSAFSVMNFVMETP